MYNKKYILEKIEESNGHNSIYDGVEGRIAYDAFVLDNKVSYNSFVDASSFLFSTKTLSSARSTTQDMQSL